MFRSLFYILISLMVTSACFACPFTVLNDSSSTIIAVDPFNHQVIKLSVGQHTIIDPSIYSWQKYFRHEKLDIYYPLSSNSANYVRKYQLTEKFCEVDPSKNLLKISDIVKFVTVPSKRFEAKAFHPKSKTDHQIKHQH